MSTTSTHNMTPHVEALLSAQLCEKYVDENGRTVVFFDVPCMSETVGIHEERYAAFKQALAQSVVYAELQSTLHRGFLDAVYYSTKVLATATIVPVLNVVQSESIKISDTTVRRKYTIAECFPLMTPDGKVVRSTSGYWYHETPAKAAAKLKQWTKAAAEFDRDMDFIDEHISRIESLAGRTSGDAPGPDTKVGDTVMVWGHGRQRLGIVAEVSKTRVKVAWTTPTAVKDGGRPVIKWHPKA